MRGQVYNRDIKITIGKLRKQGKSYREIRARFNIPKSTLSTWLNKKFKPSGREAQLEHLRKIQPLAVKAKLQGIKEAEKLLRLKVEKEVLTYPLKHTGLYKSILASLYWCEGAKHRGVSGLKFVNTDPKLAQFYITLLRKCYKTDEKKFRVRLHLHDYHNPRDAQIFWSTILNIPLNQFGKLYIKQRNQTKKFRQNFMGICFINYLDSNVRKELMQIAYQLQSFSVNKFPMSS